MASKSLNRLNCGMRQGPRNLGAARPAESTELVSQRVFERREREREIHILQAGRPSELACQQELVGQVSRNESQCRSWCLQNGGSAEDAAKRLRECMVGDGVRCNRVHGTDQAVVGDRLEEDAEQVVEGDPAHELLAAAEWTPQPEPERRDQPGEETAAPGKNDSEARQDNPNAGRRGWRGRRLPGSAHVGKEAGARRRFLGQGSVPGIAVVPDA